MKKTLLFLFLAVFCCGLHVYAQQKTVTGKVVAAEGNYAMPGVSVRIEGTSTGTQTNSAGIYTINVNTGQTLIFTFVGTVGQERVVDASNTINIQLKEDAKTLNEVVVTGALGITREKKALGYSSQTISSEELNENRQPNVVNALQGKIAGVTISSTGGGPGQGASIQIRGINSIDPSRSNQPLFVIDGVVMDNSTSASTTGTGTGSQADLRGVPNRAADINPDDIETINVLKGGAATALYGLRGANGVVVITTKSGKAGTTRVNFTSTEGFDNVNKFPEIQDVYTQGYSGVYDSKSFYPSWGPTVAAAKAIDPTHPDKLYNPFKDAYKTGWQAKNTVNLSGGTEKVVYSSTLSHFKQQGTIPFTDYQNINAKLNVNANISDKLKAGASLNYINSGGRYYNADRYNESLSYWSPRWDVTDYLTPDGTMKTYGNNNPLYGAYSNQFTDKVNRLIGSINVNYQALSWLNLSYRAGVDTYNDRRERTAPGPKGVAGEVILEDNGGGLIYDYNTNQRIITSTFIATASKSITKDFKATLRVGHDLSDQDTRSVSVTGDTLAVYNYYNISNAKVVRGNNSLTQYRLTGVFGELSLQYKNYLYLTLTGRNDWTSSLLAPNNSFFYPSASLAYVFSDHFTLPKVIDFGKLRFSYAQLGKDALPYSTSNGSAAYTSLPTGYTGFTRSALLGNPTLRPEFVNTYEGGLEMQFFKNRLGFDVSYYYSLSKDQILRANVSSTTGYVQASVNAGSMRNKGIELALNGSPVKTRSFRWDLGLTFSANRNKILDLGGASEFILASQSGYAGSTVTSKLVPGNAYGDLFGSVYQRYYPTGTTNTYQGYIIDNKNPIIIGANGFPAAYRTNTLIANSTPKWIGGLNTTFSYKNLSINALFDTRQGQYKYNQMDNWFAAFGIATYTLNRNDFKVFDGVLANGTTNTKQVWLGQGTGPDGVNYTNGYYRNSYRTYSENFVQDASWIRLRSLGLTYRFPTKMLANSIVKNASITATGNNLWLHTKYLGFDPETSSTNSGSNVTGFTGFTYPANRSFLLTLNVGF